VRREWKKNMSDNLSILRAEIEAQYENNPTGCGGSFGELLCWEIHVNNKTFIWLAEKWSINVTTLGELIYDHCKRLEPLPFVRHDHPSEWFENRPAWVSIRAENGEIFMIHPDKLDEEIKKGATLIMNETGRY